MTYYTRATTTTEWRGVEGDTTYIKNRRRFRNALGDVLELASDRFMEEPENERTVQSLVSAMASNILHYLPYLKDLADHADMEEIRGGD